MNGTTRRLLVAAAFAASLCGCGGTTEVIKPTTPSTPPKKVSDKSYVVGQEMSAFVGQAIARVKQYQINYVLSPGLRTPKAITLTVKATGSTHTIPAGTEFRNLGSTICDEQRCYVAEALPPPFQDGRLVAFLDGEFDGWLMSGDGAVYSQCNDGPICTAPDYVELELFKYEVESIVPEAKGQNFELLYSGATKDTLNLLYREYTPEDMARPAFSQNLTYDRAASTIRFRDMQIRVLSASNESLRYVIEADGLGTG